MPRGRSPERFSHKRRYSPPSMKRSGTSSRSTRPSSRSPRPHSRPSASHRSRSPGRPSGGDGRRPGSSYNRGPRPSYKRSRSPGSRRRSLTPPRRRSLTPPRKLSPPKSPALGIKKRSLSPPEIRRKRSPPPRDNRPPKRIELPPLREPSHSVNTGMPKRDYDSGKRRSSPRREEKPLRTPPVMLRDRPEEMHMKPVDTYRYEDERFLPGEPFDKHRPDVPPPGFPPETLKPLLDERFRGTTENLSFTTDELKKITVDIRRNIPRDGGPIVRRILHPEDVILIRRPGEGCRPIFDRDDIKQGMMERDDDYVEKRVVALVRGRSHSPLDRRLPSHSGSGPRENFKVSRDKYPFEHRSFPPKSSLSDRWQMENRDRKPGTAPEKLLVSVQASRSSAERGSSQYRSRIEEGPLSGSSRARTSYYEDANGARYNIKEESSRRPLPSNPNDLRHSLLSRSRSFDLVDARQKILERRERERDPPGSSRFEFSPTDSGRPREERFKTSAPFWDREKRASSSRSPGPEGSGDLPNFSARPDRYQYKEWIDKPDMVPKGPSYYEKLGRGNSASFTKRGRGGFQHDTRGDRGTGFIRRPRGRGIRGFFRGSNFRGRGMFRGPLRGGTFSMRGRGKRSPSQWQHDLFEKMSPANKSQFSLHKRTSHTSGDQDRRPSHGDQ